MIGAIIVLMLLSAILLRLWNTTIPDVFGLKPLTFWQALSSRQFFLGQLVAAGSALP